MEDRIILIDKPAGMSSFGVVARVRRGLRDEFGHKVKVGHTGTLDPFATGLLILLSGRYTKKSGEFLKLDKVYEATIKLGFVSSTGDIEGEISPYSVESCPEEGIRECLVEGIPEAAAEDKRPSPVKTGARDAAPKLNILESTLQTFIGEILQKPPKFSAIKINGQRAYKLARAGKDFEVPTRKVTIYNIEILEYNYPILKIRCHVSSGTYIRTLAEDIGEKLGTGAYCEALRRLKIGEYDVKDAEKLPKM
ncbi:tRNA pseudouridine(55) synthase TruB [Candidatus Saccharibacteria bacterium]|nr:tRNA pseudouridine(55) synthase TruB [Candidatus Saccharibacteria bacterium]